MKVLRTTTKSTRQISKFIYKFGSFEAGTWVVTSFSFFYALRVKNAQKLGCIF